MAYLFRVRNVSGVQAVFPKAQIERYSFSQQLARLLLNLRLPESLRVAFDLSDHVPEWWVALAPKHDWAAVHEAIKLEQAQPSTEQRYGLGHDAARLLEWIESRRPEEMLGNWTPVVEPNIKSQIGLAAEWPAENLPAFIQMLTDEINERTTHNLGIQPWTERGSMLTRIKVGKRKTQLPASLEDEVRELARRRGIELSEDARSAILGLLRPQQGG